MNYLKKYLLALFAVVGMIYFGRWNNNVRSNSAIIETTSNVGSKSSPVSANSNGSPIQPQTETNNPISATAWKDGSYTGPSVDAYYGNVQVKVDVSGGKIVNVSFLDYPQENGTSQRINSYAVPQLKTEAIQAQSNQVDAVSGASFTSQAFNSSLASALSQAK